MTSFFVVAVGYSRLSDFLYGWRKQLFVDELNNAYFFRRFLKTVFQWLHLAQQLLLKQCDFLIIDISQGSVATHLGCGGVFKCDFVTNFLLSLTVKIFENRLTFSRVTDRIIVSCFLTHSVVVIHVSRWRDIRWLVTVLGFVLRTRLMRYLCIMTGDKIWCLC